MNKNVVRIGASIAAMAGSAIFVMMYVANGIVHGSLVGLKGRENDLKIASVRTTWALAFALGLQIVAITVTMQSLARRGPETPAFSLERWVMTLWHLAISILVSILGTALIFELILKIGKAIRF
jgi:hypothetical protein